MRLLVSSQAYMSLPVTRRDASAVQVKLDPIKSIAPSFQLFQIPVASTAIFCTQLLRLYALKFISLVKAYPYFFV